MKTRNDVHFYKLALCVAIVLLIGKTATAMTQFTADSEVVSAMVSDKSGIWKVLTGRILSIKQVSETGTQKMPGSVTAYMSKFEIQTEEPPEEIGSHKKICALKVDVVVKRDFMVTVGTPEITYGAPVCR